MGTLLKSTSRFLEVFGTFLKSMVMHANETRVRTGRRAALNTYFSISQNYKSTKLGSSASTLQTFQTNYSLLAEVPIVAGRNWPWWYQAKGISRVHAAAGRCVGALAEEAPVRNVDMARSFILFDGVGYEWYGSDRLFARSVLSRVLSQCSRVVEISKSVWTVGHGGRLFTVFDARFTRKR